MRARKIFVLILSCFIALGAMAFASSVLAAPALPPRDNILFDMPLAQGCIGQPTIQYAYANPATIFSGQVTTLYWGLVGNANAAYLQFPNGHRQGIATPGAQQVNPTQTTTYYVVGVCGGNEQLWPIQVNVQSGPTCSGTPVLQGFSANPSTVTLGQSSTLAWGQVLNATYVQLSSQFEGGSGVASPGQVAVQPGQTTTYYLTAWCQGNTAQAQVTITVQSAAPPTPTPPPANPNSILEIQVAKESAQYKVTVKYYWNGEDAPAVVQSIGYTNGQKVTNAPTTALIAGFAKYAIQYLKIKSDASPPTNVTSCIVGSSGTELACKNVPAPK